MLNDRPSTDGARHDQQKPACLPTGAHAPDAPDVRRYAARRSADGKLSRQRSDRRRRDAAASRTDAQNASGYAQAALKSRRLASYDGGARRHGNEPSGLAKNAECKCRKARRQSAMRGLAGYGKHRSNITTVTPADEPDGAPISAPSRHSTQAHTVVLNAPASRY